MLDINEIKSKYTNINFVRLEPDDKIIHNNYTKVNTIDKLISSWTTELNYISESFGEEQATLNTVQLVLWTYVRDMSHALLKTWDNQGANAIDHETRDLQLSIMKTAADFLLTSQEETAVDFRNACKTDNFTYVYVINKDTEQVYYEETTDLSQEKFLKLLHTADSLMSNLYLDLAVDDEETADLVI